MESPQATPSSPSSLGPSSPALGSVSPGTRSRSSSRGSHLTLDLSNLPPLSQPPQPTNTLLITNLQNPEIFHPENLQNIRNIIQDHADIISWAPLKSLKRIVCSFPTEQEAILVRQALDGENIMGDRTRVYFGENTPTEPRDQHLHAPESKKLFFISPPPSPPHGWEMKNEEPPNAQVLAEDLAKALATLRARDRTMGGFDVKQTEAGEPESFSAEGGKSPIGRPRSGSTILFEPKEEDNHMPAISVEDYSDSEETHSPVQTAPVALPHTSRPPVELMN